MPRHRRSLSLLVAFFLLSFLAGACDAENPTSPETPAPAPSLSIVESEGFYQGPDGYFYYNLQPPQADLSPAIITDYWTKVWAGSNLYGVQVEAMVDWDNGDLGRNEVDYKIFYIPTGEEVHSDDEDQAYGADELKNVGAYQYISYTGGRRYHRFEIPNAEIPTAQDCGLRTVAWSTHYATKATPFRVSVSLLRIGPLGLGADIGQLPSWGEARAFSRDTADGTQCDLIVERLWTSGPNLAVGEWAWFKVANPEVCGGSWVKWTSNKPDKANFTNDGPAYPSSSPPFQAYGLAGVVTITASCAGPHTATTSGTFAINTYNPPPEPEEECDAGPQYKPPIGDRIEMDRAPSTPEAHRRRTPAAPAAVSAQDGEGEDPPPCDGEYDEDCEGCVECQQWIYYECSGNRMTGYSCTVWEEWDCYEISTLDAPGHTPFDKPRVGVILSGAGTQSPDQEIG